MLALTAHDRHAQRHTIGLHDVSHYPGASVHVASIPYTASWPAKLLSLAASAVGGLNRAAKFSAKNRDAAGNLDWVVVLRNYMISVPGVGPPSLTNFWEPASCPVWGSNLYNLILHRLPCHQRTCTSGNCFARCQTYHLEDNCQKMVEMSLFRMEEVCTRSAFHSKLRHSEGRLYAFMQTCREQYLRMKLKKCKHERNPMTEVITQWAAQKPNCSYIAQPLIARVKLNVKWSITSASSDKTAICQMNRRGWSLRQGKMLALRNSSKKEDLLLMKPLYSIKHCPIYTGSCIAVFCVEFSSYGQASYGRCSKW